MAKNIGTFFKKNLVYFIIAFSMLAMTGVGIAFLLSDNNDLPVSNVTEKPLDEQEPVVHDEPEQPNEPEPPAPTVFLMPVENGTVTVGYTKDTVVFNSTLGAYTGHMGVDVYGDDDANVICVLDGVIDSIDTTYLTGTTVTVSHSNGIKTVYNSIDVDENLKVGQTVKRGSVLGVISINNKQEYKQGAHLHFEVYENNVRIDPETYLPLGGK